MNKILEVTGLEPKKAEQIAKALGDLLANFQIHYSNLRGYHWHVVGKQFFTLHSALEKSYDEAAENVDDLAERILQLGSSPENRFSHYVKESEIKETHNINNAEAIVEAILSDYKVLIAKERAIVELAGEASDEATVALMDDLLKQQEKTTWMLAAYLTK